LPNEFQRLLAKQAPEAGPFPFERPRAGEYDGRLPPMLVDLHVSNFVLIERLEIHCEPGFNVLTGETGAGKSIVVGALGLVLGWRGAPDLVRPGSDQAEVEALFDTSRAPRAKALLAEAGLDAGDELVLRRVVQSSGRSRAYANGRLCTAAQLSALACELVDISSQHESVALASQTTHLGYLDAFAGLDSDRIELGLAVGNLLALSKQIVELAAAERGRAEREAFLRFQLSAVDEIDPKPGEIEELAAEKTRLRHAGLLGQSTRSAADRLYDKDGAICDDLARIAADLGQATEIDPELHPLSAGVGSARAELQEIARSLGRYAENVESNPGRLDEVEDRLFQLGKLVRQHGADISDLLAARERLRAELDSLGGVSDELERQRARLSGLLEHAGKRARDLSAARKRAATRLGKQIGKELGALGMGQAKVVVEIAALGGAGREASDLAVDGARLGPDGIDRVEFLIAPNPGAPPRPLSRIASGGELSRALLALKRVLADVGPAGLYVFDEVDAGIGGAVAERIGRAIADVARHRQVLCITHHPAIAAFADAHFVVDKRDRGGVATTEVTRARGRQRLDEMARMLGGERITAAVRKAAEGMLHEAGKLAPSDPAR
jgi:DNA repair protein RecN (Recombination protein N)